MPQKKKPDVLEAAFRTSWFDALPLPVFILDRDGKIAYANGSVTDLIGYSRQKMIGATPDMYVLPSDAPRLLRDELKLFRGIQIGPVQYDLRRRNGSFVRATTAFAPIFGRNGKTVTYILGIIMDQQEFRKK